MSNLFRIFQTDRQSLVNPNAYHINVSPPQVHMLYPFQEKQDHDVECGDVDALKAVKSSALLRLFRVFDLSCVYSK